MKEKVSHLYTKIIEHMEVSKPYECCGIIAKKDSVEYFPCKNLSTRVEDFIIDPEDLASIEDRGYEILVVVHSHPSTNSKPSQSDLVSIEQTELPWLIVDGHGNIEIFYPTGYIAPLEGRLFHYGIVDCFTLIRDYYKVNFNIYIKDFERYGVQWWEDYGDSFEELFSNEGFIQVPIENIKENDLLVMALGSSIPNHYAIYMGGNKIIHHAIGRLSCIESISQGYYSSIKYVLRRKELL